MENNELKHWGVKGMRWGVRRYQNADGTLTAAGKKRYAQEMNDLKNKEKVLKNKQRTKAQLDKLDKKRRELKDLEDTVKGKKKPEPDTQVKPKKRSIKDMSDDELNAAINRMKLEKSYRELITEQKKNADTSSTSKGKAFAKAFWKDAVRPGLTEASKEIIKTSVKNAAESAIKKKKNG